MSLSSVEKTSEIVDTVIDCVGKLFRKNGYKKTTVDDIASALHISKKTLYKVFPSKETILHEALWHETKEVLKIFNETLPSDSRADTELLSWCRFIFTDRMERNEDGYFWSIHSGDSFIQDAALDALKRVVYTIYNEGRSHGLFKPIHPGFASAAIVSIITTALNSFHTVGDQISMFNEALGMIKDSVSRKQRLPSGSFKREF